MGLGLEIGREGAPGSDLKEELSPLPGPNQNRQALTPKDVSWS